MSAPHCLLASFNDRHIGVECRTDWLATELRRRLMHVMTAPGTAPSEILRITLEELEVSWIEVRDSTGRCECGSLDYAAFHARKWMTTAFVAAHPDLIWLHAAAASRDGAAILLAGPAGAGKSTLLVRLVERGLAPASPTMCWRFGRPAVRRCPCHSARRSELIPRAPEQAWPAFLEQPKALSPSPRTGGVEAGARGRDRLPGVRRRPRPTARHAADSRVGDTGAGDAGARCPPRRRKHRRAVPPGAADPLLPTTLRRLVGRGG